MKNPPAIWKTFPTFGAKITPRNPIVQHLGFGSEKPSQTMSTSSHQMDEMKELICSSSKTNKSLGYTSLLHFQEHTSGDSSSIEALAQSSCSLIHCIVVDISDDDEEM